MWWFLLFLIRFCVVSFSSFFAAPCVSSFYLDERANHHHHKRTRDDEDGATTTEKLERRHSFSIFCVFSLVVQLSSSSFSG